MSKRRRCSREGCAGTYTEKMHENGSRHCSMICLFIDRELDHQIGLCQRASDPRRVEQLTEGYTRLVEIADLVSGYWDVMEDVYGRRQPTG